MACWICQALFQISPVDSLTLELAQAALHLPGSPVVLWIMLKESISGQDVIKAIQKEVWNLPVDNSLKVALTEKTGEAEFRLVEGADEFIQLEALLAGFISAGMGGANGVKSEVA